MKHMKLPSPPVALLFALILGFANSARAAAPDLTNGGVLNTNYNNNLGPTGLAGKVYHNGADTSQARQFLVTEVDSGSPADGLIQADDVILGASGNGTAPTNFTYDARIALAAAINDAEENNPAVLKVLIWRAGTTSVADLTLQTLGSYSATAPYNCPKSALIVENAVVRAMVSGDSDDSYSGIGTLFFMAADDPAHPDHAARRAKIAAEVQKIMPTQQEIDDMMNGWTDVPGSPGWSQGMRLMVLCEYYNLVGDVQIGAVQLGDAIQAIGHMVANGADIFGGYGHGFAREPISPLDNTMTIAAYGPVNSAGLGCYLGMSLTKKCGLATPKTLEVLESANNYYGSYVNRGGIPYGEMQPWIGSHSGNGKAGAAALAFSLQPERAEEARYFGKYSAAGSDDRETGHSTTYFNQWYTGIGAATVGDQAAMEHFSRAHWQLDLARDWKGGFDWNQLVEESKYCNTPSARSTTFPVSVSVGLTYALGGKKIALTGKYANPSLNLSTSELAQVALADGYDASVRSNGELLQDLESFSATVRQDAAIAIAARTADHGYFLPPLTAMLNDYTDPGCIGACQALARMKEPSALQALVNLLTCPDYDVRWASADAIGYYYRNADIMAYGDQIMDAVLANQQPAMPLDPEDPLQMAQGMLARRLFYGGGASAEQGLYKSSLDGVDREKLYDVITAFTRLPSGGDRGMLQYVYAQLTDEEFKAVSEPILDSIYERAPGEGMFAHSVRQHGVSMLIRLGYAESIPLSKYLADFFRITKPGFTDTYMSNLQALGGSCLLVEPDPEVIKFCEQFVLNTPLIYPEQITAAQNAIDAILADTNPQAMPMLKGIDSLTVDNPVLTLPVNRTVIRAQTHNYGSDSIFTWRKVHGPGEVTFAPYADPDDGSRTIIFDGVPGEYKFELTLSDSRQLTEAKETVSVRLEMAGGGLPANDPPVADARSLTVNQGAPLPIVLTGSDPEGYELNYRITAGPANGSLSGTPPFMRYTSRSSYLGNDSFDFEVMDSNGQVSSATISITVNNAAPVGLAIYEPFNYAANVSLNGQSSPADVGFAAPWVTSGTTVRAGSLGDGDIQTEDGHISDSLRSKGSRLISSAALADRGLLDDGSTLWFSGYFGTDAGSNTTNGQFAFALANSAFNSGTHEWWIEDEGPQAGSGIGFKLEKVWSSSASMIASQFRDISYGSGKTGNVDGSDFRDGEMDSGYFLKAGVLDEYFFVGKITWGATANDVDRIEIYQTLDPNVLPEHPCSVLETHVDQSTFDTLTISSGGKYVYDEIRFGESYHSVLAGTVAMADDLSAPTPDPIAFLEAPYVSGLDSISMSAMPADDANAVEYYFTCTSGGGNDSGWQSSRDYTDTGLTPGVPYSYTVTTRDLSPAKNTSSPSAASSATIPNEWIVEDMVGISAVSAKHLISRNGLATGKVTYVHDPGIPDGTVISLGQSAGSTAALGSAIDMVVSLGPVRTSVPFVEDLNQTAAQTAITNAGFTVGTVTTQPSTEAAGEVVSQNPPSGYQALPGSAVDLVVSTGPSSATGVVSIVDSFSFKGDLATDPAYSSNPGSDSGAGDLYGVDKPLTIPVTGFTSAGSDKLVGILSMHNSAATTSDITGLTYAGIDVFSSNVVKYNSGWTAQICFYIDNPTTDGNLVISLDAQNNVDEVSLALFALNGTEDGFKEYADGSPGLTVSAGDLLVGLGQRNNGTNMTVAAPFTGIDLKAGNLNAEAVHLVAAADGTYQPTYQNASAQTTMLVSFGAEPPTAAITVPDAVGSLQAAAELSITSAGFLVGSVTTAYDGSVPAGEVSHQSPAGGSSAAPNTAVNLVVSLGADPDAKPSVPDVVGSAEASAQSAITGAGLAVGTVSYQHDSSAPAGAVLGQNPVGGALTDPGTSVDLVVSLGPPMTTVPGVVGLAEATAATEITSANLVVGAVSYQNDAAVPVGEVISQNPAGGSSVAEGSGVDIVVSLGPTMETVPNVVGLAESAAQAAITGANLVVGTVTYQYDTVVPAGDVISQDPAGGGSVIQGSSVNLVISEGVGGVVTIADTFTFKGDLANDPAYSSNPGHDTGAADLYGADKPITIPVSGFASAGRDKLVGILSMHNSAATTSTITGITYAGVDVFTSNTIEYSGGWTQQLIFYLDDPTADGNLVISLGAQDNVDEVGLVLFALDGTEPGSAESATGGGTSPALAVSAGDLIVGLGQRNNQSSMTVEAPFTGIDLQTGNLNAEAAYLIATSGNTYQPVYATVTAQATMIASFKAKPPAVSVTVPDVTGLAEATAQSTITGAGLTVGTVTSQHDAVVPVGNVISQSPGGGETADVGTGVDLVVSLGPPQTTVPNVLGLAEATAQSAITAANLVVGTMTDQYDAVVPAGDVISQGLSAGSTVDEGSSVDLVVSLGLDLSPKLVRTTVSAVSNTGWTTVSLGRTYNSPVVIATPIYPTGFATPVVTRITNMTSTGFDLKLDRADGLTGTVSIDVSIVAVDEGVYTQAVDGVTMEAVKFTSTITAENNSWVSEARTYQNSYTNPVVVGQVMSANDSNWSAFWSSGSSRLNPADASNLNVGKMVGEDPNTTRADETIGYIVIESGNGSIEGVNYTAGVGSDSVMGLTNGNPATYGLSGLTSASAAAASLAGMDGTDGAWAVLAGATPFSATGITLYAAEDQLGDSEQGHTTEQVGYIVFE